MDPFETVVGFKAKVAIIIMSVSSIFTCTLIGHQKQVEYEAEN